MPHTKLMIIPLLMIFCFLLHSVACSQEYLEISPVGGKQQLQEFLCNEVVYPPGELEKGTEGTVVITFDVYPDGTKNNAEIIESVSPEIDAEAVRVFEKTLWNPAYRLGNPVQSRTKLTIKFDIKKYNKHCKKRGYQTLDYPFQPIDTSNTVYTKDEVDALPRPVFDDPLMNLQKFIRENLEYPDPAFRQNIAGTVKLSFVVETHGKISHIVTVDPLAGGCTEEARRIVKKLEWMPGIKDDKAVRTRIPMEITFKLPAIQEMH